MSWRLIGGQNGGLVNSPDAPSPGLRLQTSIDGKPRQIFWGCTRLPVNLLWYGNFFSQQQSQSSAKGKTAAIGSGTASLVYFASFVAGIGCGPIGNIIAIWVNKLYALWTTASTSYNLSLFAGDYTQSSWAYLTSIAPGQDLNYRGEAYVGVQSIPLGTSPDLPNVNAACVGRITNAFGTTDPFFPSTGSFTYDANPRDVIADALTNPNYGVLFPPGRVGDWTNYSNWCLASNLVVSPVLTDQRPLASDLNDLMAGTVAQFFWSSGQLQIAPYGDANVVGNGTTYTANVTPIYDLTDNDFIPGINGNSDAPIICHSKRLEDVINSIALEYLSGDYNPVTGASTPFNQGLGSYDPAVVMAQDDAHVSAYGLRAGGSRSHHFFTTLGSAVASANLQLGREAVLNTYVFRLPSRYILLDPMDLVTLTETNTGMFRQFVRIIEITENDDGTLDILAEEFLGGTANAPKFGSQAKQGGAQNRNAIPGAVNAPLIFEPPDQIANGLFIWIAISAAGSNWGGCEVWISYGSDTNATYVKLGERMGQSNVGVTSAPLAALATVPTQGPIIDSTDTLAVDMAKSQTVLTSGTVNDLLAANTLLYVDNPAEYLAYQTATPTSTYAANLTVLNRGLYGTSNAAHASGANVAEINGSLFRLPYTQDHIGQTVYLKFPSFNTFGGARQALSDVGAYAYTIVGTALTSPLPNVASFTVISLAGGSAAFFWDEISDFRQPIQYEIRKGGSSFNAGVSIGRFSHPGVPCLSDDVYWIAAVCQPIPGLTIYSASASQLVVTGAIQPLNLLTSVDEQASGWPGSLVPAPSNVCLETQ